MKASALLAASLRKKIMRGKIKTGDFLPSVRQLSKDYGRADKTVQRALKTLAAEGLIQVEPSMGYRVLARANDPHQGHPIAFVTKRDFETDTWHVLIQNSLQDVAAERSWRVQDVIIDKHNKAKAIEQLQSCRAWGAFLDTVDIDLLSLFEKSGLTVLMIDAWVENAPFDVVLQDNYQGGFLAAAHLIEKGHQQIHWFGPLNESAMSRERIGGAVANMLAHDIELPPEARIKVGRDNMSAAALELLSRRNHPKAILSLWSDMTRALVQAAHQLGMKPGVDFDIVGWIVEEKYPVYRSFFDDGPVAPAIVWSMEDMAHVAVSRLAERWHYPRLPPMRLNIPARLKLE